MNCVRGCTCYGALKMLYINFYMLEESAKSALHEKAGAFFRHHSHILTPCRCNYHKVKRQTVEMIGTFWVYIIFYCCHYDCMSYISC